MKVIEIVHMYLEEHGYDGLYCEECSCEVNDICPFNMDALDCKAGYKTKCDPETCSADGQCDFHIGPKGE